MSVNVWFVIVPWLAFGAGLIGLYAWLRRPPRSPRSPRTRWRASRGDMPDQRRQGGEHDAQLGLYKNDVVMSSVRPGMHSRASL